MVREQYDKPHVSVISFNNYQHFVNIVPSSPIAPFSKKNIFGSLSKKNSHITLLNLKILQHVPRIAL